MLDCGYVKLCNFNNVKFNVKAIFCKTPVSLFVETS
jgi:hypothetical protein